MSIEIIVDPEIEALIPSLKDGEQSKLRESIDIEGCRDPLVVWKGRNILLDGHNRYAICRELGTPFKAIELAFQDKDHAMLWVLKNQLGRRNLSDFQFKLLVGQEYELEKKLTPNSHGTNQYSEVKAQNEPQPKSTAEKLAEEHGISRETVKRSADLYKAVEAVKEIAPDVAQKLESEEIKTSDKAINAVGKVLQKGTPEQKETVTSELKEDFKKATDTAKEILSPRKIPEQMVDPVQAVREWEEGLRAKSDMPAIPKYITDLLDFKEIKAMLEELSCPCCGAPAAGKLVWKCCGSTLDDAIEKVETKVDKRFDELNAASKARREAAVGRS